MSQDLFDFLLQPVTGAGRASGRDFELSPDINDQRWRDAKGLGRKTRSGLGVILPELPVALAERGHLIGRPLSRSTDMDADRADRG